ncbi:probable metabolite transport protein CsbC isoform X2 [Diabrotica undecimpunctata]|uniref:probable metabolite transport protein CsbC isoform X2 n=1 Tax=Diabrotica undecimpunctata TaxID=50387 RepID=UPI003B63F7FB
MEEVKYIPDESEKQPLQPNNDVKIKRRDTWYLCFTVFTTMLVMFSGATTLAWPSPALVKLKSNDTRENPLGMPIKTIEVSLLVGVPYFIAIFGSLFLPKLSDLVGRKGNLQILGTAIFLNILGVAFSTRIELIIIFLSIGTACFSALYTVIPVYFTEICEDHNRAKYGCVMLVFLPLGSLYTYVLGTTFSLKLFTILTAVPLILFQILFLFAPESPTFLLSKGKTADCISTIKRLRCNKSKEELAEDFNKIMLNLQAINRNIKPSFFAFLKTKEGRVGYYLSIVPMIIRSSSGVPVVTALLAPILNEAGTKISGNTGAIIVGIVSALCSVFPCFVVEKFGRKALLIPSTLGTGSCSSILGVFFYLKYIKSPLCAYMQWLPIVCVSLYIVFYFVGLGPIPVTIPGELFLSDVRSVGVAFVMASSAIALSLIAFTYPLLADAIGTYWCFWIFAICSFLGVLFIYFVLPETKGKTIIEIQQILKNY